MEPNISPRKFDNVKIMQPGMVGSVGCVLTRTRLKQSCPDISARYRIKNNTQGSYITDLLRLRTNLLANGQGRGFRTRNGLRVQDLKATDNLTEPHVGSIGNFSWRNQVATVYETKRTGENFLPLPGHQGLLPGQLPRGGNTFDVVAIAGPQNSVVTTQESQQYQVPDNPLFTRPMKK